MPSAASGYDFEYYFEFCLPFQTEFFFQFLFLLFLLSPRQAVHLPEWLLVFLCSGAVPGSPLQSHVFPAALNEASLQTGGFFPLLLSHCSKAGGTVPPAFYSFPQLNAPCLISGFAPGVPEPAYLRALLLSSGYQPVRVSAQTALFQLFYNFLPHFHTATLP